MYFVIMHLVVFISSTVKRFYYLAIRRVFVLRSIVYHCVLDTIFLSCCWIHCFLKYVIDPVTLQLAFTIQLIQMLCKQ